MGNRERASESGRPRKKHRIWKTMICLAILIAVTAGYARYIEPYSLTQREVRYLSEDLAALPGGIKVAVFADTHFSEYYTPENFQKVVDRINAENPDLIFFLGDLIDDYSTYSGDVGEIEKGLRSLHAKIGKYAVYGNHDYGGEMEFDYPDVMKAGGFDLLINESVYFEDLNLEVMGIDDMVIGYGDPAAAAALKEERYSVVLCHEPDIADRLKDYAVDLMLAGHTHGRQINLWFFDDYILPKYGKKYVKGEFDLPAAGGRDLQLYVTRGIGMTKIPMRFASPPEVNTIELEGRP